MFSILRRTVTHPLPLEAAVLAESWPFPISLGFPLASGPQASAANLCSNLSDPLSLIGEHSPGCFLFIIPHLTAISSACPSLLLECPVFS